MQLGVRRRAPGLPRKGELPMLGFGKRQQGSVSGFAFELPLLPPLPPVAVVRKRKCTRERGVVSNGLQVCKSDSVSFAVKPRARLVVAILRAQLVVAILAGREGNGERLCSTAQGEY